MQRKILLFLFVFLISIPNFKVKALTAPEIESRVTECQKIELAEAKEDGSLTTVACYETYEEAKNIMNNTPNDNLVLVEEGKILDAKYALIDYEISYPAGHNNYISVYPTKDSNNADGAYIKGGTPDDAAFLEMDYATKRARIKISGLEGWINRYDGSLRLYEIVPLVWVKKSQYYQVTNDNLIHVFPASIMDETNQGGGSTTLDLKPEMLEVGNYYSYDGHYFYKDLKTLLEDYKNHTYEHSVNPDKPYYNYYQYLSFRTKTSYSEENLNQFLNDRITKLEATKGEIYTMKNTGHFFVDAQNLYGVNAALMMAIGINESGYGSSPIARNKNNLFGLDAVDSNPYGNASVFESIEDCIYNYAYGWLSYKYLQPGEYYGKFRGANLGNKLQGLNYRYASDPFWGEKAAHYYYELDKYFGFQDRNSVKLAVLNNSYNNQVYAKKTPGGVNVSTDYYQYKLKDSSVAVIEEVIGPMENGSNLWYKIMSDPVIDSNLDYTGSSKSNPRVLYDWNTSQVYVSASYFTKINFESNAQPEEVTPPTTPTNPEKAVPTPKAIKAIVEEANYDYQAGLIYGIQPSTTVETIKNNLTHTGGVVTITDAGGNTKESGIIGTGDIVNITSGLTEKLVVLIYGDTNGDGNITASDYVRIKNHIMATSILSDIYLKASDVNKDNQVSAVDYVNVKNYIMGSANVIQNGR